MTPLLSPSPDRDPSPDADPSARFELLPTGAAAFARILARIAGARRTIRVRAFEWRDDDTGQSVARALLAAADRGVEVTILKDRLGGFYEHLEATKQSFFPQEDRPARPLAAPGDSCCSMGGGARCASRRARWPTRWRPHPGGAAPARREAVRPRQAVRLRRRDASSWAAWGSATISATRERQLHGRDRERRRRRPPRRAPRRGEARFDAARPFDYLLHAAEGNARTGESLAAQRLALIAGARRRLTIAMGYLGDAAAAEAASAGRDRARRPGHAAHGGARRRRRRSRPPHLRQDPAPHRRPRRASA